MSENEISCPTHGATRAAFVCSHVLSVYRTGRPPEMVCQPPAEDDPFPDAWCEACESEFQEAYDSLVDGFSPTGGLAAICRGCYLDIRQIAARARTLRIV